MQFRHMQVLSSPHGTVGQCPEKHSCRIFPPSQKVQQQSSYSVDLHSSDKFLKKHNSSRVRPFSAKYWKSPLSWFCLGCWGRGSLLRHAQTPWAKFCRCCQYPAHIFGSMTSGCSSHLPTARISISVSKPFFSEGVVRYSAWTPGRCQEINTQ